MFTGMDKAIAGFLAALIVGALKQYAHVDLSPEAQLGLSSFLVGLIVFLIPNKQSK